MEDQDLAFNINMGELESQRTTEVSSLKGGENTKN